jgi:hypothetical protein
VSARSVQRPTGPIGQRQHRTVNAYLVDGVDFQRRGPDVVVCRGGPAAQLAEVASMPADRDCGLTDQRASAGVGGNLAGAGSARC